MSSGEGDLALVRRLQEENARLSNENTTLKSGGGGGTSGGMEARIAKLEANMQHVQAELAKLATVPVDVASVKERLQHLPTHAEVRDTLDDGLEKLGTSVQRTVVITASVMTILLGIIGVALKILLP